MIKLFTSLAFLFVTTLVAAQPANTLPGPGGKVKLSTGQTIIVETTIDIDASLAMGMELTSTSSSTNSLEVKNTSAANSTITSKLTRLKVNMNMMGQPNNYDSDNKAGNSGEMARVLDDKLNKPVDLVLDNTTGLIVTDKQKNKKNSLEDGDPTAGLMSMFADNSDDALVSGAFEVIPTGKTIGDSWADTSNTKEIKTIRNYTLKSISGNEATIAIDISTKAVNKVDFQGMEFEIKTDTKTKGEIVTDVTTALTKKRTTRSDIAGSFQMMGQEMPITATSNATTIYK